jgi:hypothetical protein
LSLQLFFLHKTLAAKLHEGHELLNVRFFGAKVSLEYRDNKELSDLARKINSYFSKNNLIDKLRNDFASHHFDQKKAFIEIFNAIDNEYLLAHYTSGQMANTIFFGSQEVELGAMLNTVGPITSIEERNKALQEFRDEVLDMAQLFGDFVTVYMNACIEKNLQI